MLQRLAITMISTLVLTILLSACNATNQQGGGEPPSTATPILISAPTATVEADEIPTLVPPTAVPEDDTAVSETSAHTDSQPPVAETEPAPVTTWETREGDSPLTTWAPNEGELLPDVGGQGTLGISEDCVRLTLPNQTVILPVWPEPTSWNPTSQTIEFVGVAGERIELRDGDVVTVGGFTPTVVHGEPEFVMPPQPSCDADELFIINSIKLVTD